MEKQDAKIILTRSAIIMIAISCGLAGLVGGSVIGGYFGP